MIEAFSTILNHHKKIHYDQIERHFVSHTKRILSSIIPYTHVTNLIQTYNLNFKIEDDGMVSLTNKDEILKRLKSFEIPIKPETKYFEKGYKQDPASNSSHGSTKCRSENVINTNIRKSEENKRMVIEDSEEISDIIFLSDDDI